MTTYMSNNRLLNEAAGPLPSMRTHTPSTWLECHSMAFELSGAFEPYAEYAAANNRR